VLHSNRALCQAPEELSDGPSCVRRRACRSFLRGSWEADTCTGAASTQGIRSRASAYRAAWRKFGHPVGEHVGVQPTTAWQQAFDPLDRGAPQLLEAHNFSALTTGFSTAVFLPREVPRPSCEIFSRS